MYRTCGIVLVATAACVVSGNATRALGETVYWWGFGPDSRWSTAANWSSNPDTPGPNDDVVHSMDFPYEVIEMEAGSPGNPVLIKSFTMSADGGDGLIIQAGRALTVSQDFQSFGGTAPAGEFFDLTLEAGAKLSVGGTLGQVDAALEEGIVGSTTSLSASNIVASRGNILSLGSVTAQSMDLRGAYPRASSHK